MTIEERLNLLEVSVIKLNSLKMNISDLDTYRNVINTQIADIRFATNSLVSRVEALETLLMNYISSQ